MLKKADLGFDEIANQCYINSMFDLSNKEFS